MKQFFSIGILAMSLFVLSCNEAPKESGTHTHDDGSTHSDHDTTAPVQQEFKPGDSTARAADSTAAVDSTKEHQHADGEKHSH